MVMLSDQLLLEVVQHRKITPELHRRILDYLETYSDYDPMHLDDFRDTPLTQEEMDKVLEVLNTAWYGLALCEFNGDPEEGVGNHEIYGPNNTYIREHLNTIARENNKIARHIYDHICSKPNRIDVNGFDYHYNWRNLIVEDKVLRAMVEEYNVG